MEQAKKVQDYIYFSISQLLFILKNIVPRKKTELIIFVSFTFLFSSLAIFLVEETVIHIRHGVIRGVDYCFSFDTPALIAFGHNGAMNHPLLLQFLKPVSFLGSILEQHNYKYRVYVYVIFNTTLISLSIIYIYRYIKNLIGLNGYPLFLFTLLFGFSWTNLILSFSPESFGLTSFFTILTIYCYTYFIIHKKKVSILFNLIFAFLLGGTTVTNIVKGIIPIYFTENFKRFVLKSIVVGGLFILMWLLWIKPQFNTMSDNIMMFSNVDNNLIHLQNIIIFFNIPLLASKIIWDPGAYAINPNFSAYANFDFLTYSFAFIVIALIILSIIKNYKNKAVQMIVLFLWVDIGIHIICKFGIHELFLYSGHWIFIYPLLFAWLYKSLVPQYKKYMIIIVSTLFSFMVTNNLIELTNFVELALENFSESKRSQIFITLP